MNTFILIGMLVVITLIHEASHAIVALLLGYKLNKLYLGIPLSTPFKVFGKIRSTTIFKTTKNGIEYGVSWLIFGGAVDFDDLDNAPWWKTSLIAMAGPVSNLLLAWVALYFFAGPIVAVQISSVISMLVFNSLVMLFTGQIPLSQLTGPVGFVHAMSGVVQTYQNGWLLIWTLLNITLFVTNILPIPALDGGHIFLSIISTIFGQKTKTPIKWLTYGFLYFLCFLMILISAKDIVAGIPYLLNVINH